MRILIDIGHPAHVHLFRNLALDMVNKGHEILFTCREKEFEIDLLSHYKLPFESLGKKPSSLTGKLTGLVKFDCKLFSVARKFRPDLFLSHGSHYAAHVSLLTGRPHIALEDTYNFEQIWLYKPFTSVILTSDYEHPLKSGRVIRYSGYHELAYLHPNRFIPDRSVLKELGMEESANYIIIRFVSWQASHDIGHKGLSLEDKLFSVTEFSRHAKVFISSEAVLPKELEEFRLSLSPERIHDALAYSSLLFGESSTMAEEAAILGIPAFFLNNKSTYYSKHLEKEYGLLFNYSESESDLRESVRKGIELLNTPGVKQEWQEKRAKLLREKIDVTPFLVWFVENWPESFRIMKENPDYQMRFR